MTTHNDEQPQYTIDQLEAFLRGSAPLDGVWFGEKHPTERGAYWWRKYLRAAVELRTPSNEPQPAAGYFEALMEALRIERGSKQWDQAVLASAHFATLSSRSMPVAPAAPLLARHRNEWHEDDGPVMWWAWCGHEWAGEAPWCGTPLDSDWPGYHTHWTIIGGFPTPPASNTEGK